MTFHAAYNYLYKVLLNVNRCFIVLLASRCLFVIYFNLGWVITFRKVFYILNVENHVENTKNVEYCVILLLY